MDAERADRRRLGGSPAWRYWWDPLRELATPRRGSVGLMLLVSAVGSVGSGIALLALPFFLIDRGFTLAEVGFLFGFVAVAEIAGQLAVSRRPWVLEDTTLALGLLVASSLAWPGLLLARSPLAFIAVLCFAALAGAAAAPAVQLMLARMRGADGAAVSFAAGGLLVGMGKAAGVAVGGLLLPLGFGVAFYAAALVSLVGVAVTAFVLLSGHVPPPAAGASRRVRVSIARAWLRASRMSRALRAPATGSRTPAWAAAHAFLFGMSLAAYPFFLPQLLAARGLGMEWLGFVVAASWLTFALAQPLGAWAAARLGRPRPVMVASLAAAALLNALLLSPGLAVVVAAWVALGVADGMGRPLVRAMLVETTQDADLGATFGWLGSAETASRVAGPYAVALAALMGGFTGAFGLAALLVLASIPPLLAIGAGRPVRAVGGAVPA